MTINIKRCTACGHDHVEVEPIPLPAPIPQADLFEPERVVIYTHRVECPKTGQALLLALWRHE